MSTDRKINYKYQVKELNGKRWVCVEVQPEWISNYSMYDFVCPNDSRLWKKIRPWSHFDLEDRNIAGQSQYFDDKNNTAG